jgi:DNA-binding NarL/FixJ family response regulator
MEVEDGPAPPPRFIGIDDRAWRKGRRYGTIVVDLERGRVIDLLPGRDAETVKRWLAAHPGVELISRDRRSEYALAATEAVQAVVRWHLLKNLREAIERLFERRSGPIAEAVKALESLPEVVTAPASPPVVDERPAAETPDPPACEASPGGQAGEARRRRRSEAFDRVHALRRQGRSVRRIAKDLGLSRNSVRRHLRHEACPVRPLYGG